MSKRARRAETQPVKAPVRARLSGCMLMPGLFMFSEVKTPTEVPKNCTTGCGVRPSLQRRLT
jgi:hypothetical protein